MPVVGVPISSFINVMPASRSVDILFWESACRALERIGFVGSEAGSVLLAVALMVGSTAAAAAAAAFVAVSVESMQSVPCCQMVVSIL